MPGKRKQKVPSYRLHKPSGLAVVRINCRDIYLGKCLPVISTQREGAHTALPE